MCRKLGRFQPNLAAGTHMQVAFQINVKSQSSSKLSIGVMGGRKSVETSIFSSTDYQLVTCIVVTQRLVFFSSFVFICNVFTMIEVSFIIICC